MYRVGEADPGRFRWDDIRSLQAARLVDDRRGEEQLLVGQSLNHGRWWRAGRGAGRGAACNEEHKHPHAEANRRPASS